MFATHYSCTRVGRYDEVKKRWTEVEVCKGLNDTSPDKEYHIRYITKTEANLLNASK